MKKNKNYFLHKSRLIFISLAKKILKLNLMKALRKEFYFNTDYFISNWSEKNILKI